MNSISLGGDTHLKLKENFLDSQLVSQINSSDDKLRQMDDRLIYRPLEKGTSHYASWPARADSHVIALNKLDSQPR